MKANYNSWFYEYNKYLTATRGDKKDFIDTKWVDINHRMNTLRNLKTDLIKDLKGGRTARYIAEILDVTESYISMIFNNKTKN